jgi:hypothetical protein
VTATAVIICRGLTAGKYFLSVADEQKLFTPANFSPMLRTYPRTLLAERESAEIQDWLKTPAAVLG